MTVPVPADAEQVAHFYSQALRMDGTPVELPRNEGGSACGVWVDHDGAPVIEMIGQRSVGMEKVSE